MSYVPTEKGIYQPPSIEKYPNLKMRFIKISSFIDKEFLTLSGKMEKILLIGQINSVFFIFFIVIEKLKFGVMKKKKYIIQFISFIEKIKKDE